MKSAAAAWSSPAAGLRQRLVGDLAYEHVLERVLRIPSDPRHGLAPQQAAVLEQVEHLVDPVVVGVEPLERPEPEDLPDRRGREDNRALALRQRVEPGGDDVPDRGRDLLVRIRRVLGHRGGELLDEERIALGRLGES